MNFPYDVKAAGQLLASADTKATTLHVIALAAYGAEALYGGDPIAGDIDSGSDPVEPAILFNQLESDFSVSIPPENENKLNAIMLAVSSDGFYYDPTVFVSVCGALDDGELGDLVNGLMEDLSIPEIIWACFEVALNRDDGEDADFSPAVMAIMKESLDSESEDLDVEGSEVLPYYDRHLQAEKTELLNELTKLGVAPEYLAMVNQMDPTELVEEVPVFDQPDN